MTITVDDLRTSLRQTEGCILDADNDTLMIAVRIPRAAIRANHGLLAALSEAGVAWKSPPVAPSIEAKEIITKTLIERAATSIGDDSKPPANAIRASLASLYRALPHIAGMAAVALVVTAIGMVGISALSSPAMDVRDMVILTPLVKQGGTLRVLAMVRSNHPCPYHAIRIIKDAAGEVVWRQETDITATPLKLGIWTRSEIPITLPSSLLPGDYSYEAQGMLACAKRTETVEFPLSSFEIIE